MIPDLTPQKREEIQKLIASGRKIEAIKALRECTGLDLAVAKAAVEAWKLDPAAQMPGKLASGQQLDDLKQSLFAGRRIDAIKLLRDRTGMSLKESKDMVEAYEAELRAASPEKFTGPPPGSAKGCLVVLALLLGVAGAVVFLFVR